MRYFLAILFSFLAFGVMSQIPANKGGQGMNQGQFYGKILDASTNRPLEGASIQLIQNKLDTLTKKKRDFTIAILLSDKKGEFLIDQLPVMGNFKLNISNIGYVPYSEKVSFDISGGAKGDMNAMLNNVIKDLGNIRLEVDSVQLESVVVTASKPLLQMNLDRKVYNVEKDISAAGGTALDIMKNVPSLNVDIDGNVSLRNSTPQIFVDGRPSNLTLDQIPADQIASVEIITNPSAKYDASGGGAGILNIVLKKARKSGYNGNLRAGIDSYGRPGGGGDINIRQGKINFFSSLYVNLPKSTSTGSTNRTDFFPGDSVSLLSQENAPEFKGGFGYARLGLDYFVDNRNTFTLSSYYSKRKFETSDLLNINRKYFKNDLLTDSEIAQRISESTSKGDNYGGSLSFKHNYTKPGKEITADVNYSYRSNNSTSDYRSNYFDNNNIPELTTVERSLTGGNVRSTTIQTDYVDPISKTKKIEAGLRYSNRNYNSLNSNLVLDNSGNYILLPALGSEYKFTDEVYAAYGTYSQQIDKFSFQTGLRVESSKYNGNYISKNSKFSNNYPFSLFPSLYMTYKITNKQDLQMNYSRKINRPNFFQLIPFIDYSDSLNLTVGNPDLVPEFTNLVEIGYSNQYSPGNSIFLNLYGKNTNNLITGYQYRDVNPNPAKNDSLLFSTYANANQSYSVGLELTGRNKIAKWWDLTSNVNLYNATIKAGNLPGTSDNSQFSWFAKINNSFKLPKDFSIQLTGDYQAKTLIPAGGGGRMFYGSAQTTSQGYIKPNYGADISIRKNFMKNNAASLTLSINDIFLTRTSSSYASSDFFIQENERIRKGQVFRLNFNWKFGKFDASLFKRKNVKGDMENMRDLQNPGQ